MNETIQQLCPGFCERVRAAYVLPSLKGDIQAKKIAIYYDDVPVKIIDHLGVQEQIVDHGAEILTRELHINDEIVYGEAEGRVLINRIEQANIVFPEEA